jgi:hypothetical protein
MFTSKINQVARNQSFMDKNRRFQMYKFCSAHFDYTARQELPFCVMEVIRNTFKEGSVTGFKEK